MKKAIFIDGGAGRVISAIPALIKLMRNNPDDDIRIFVFGWDTLLWGIPELQDKIHSQNVKGIFESKIKDVDVTLSPEPYRLPSYYNLKKSLVEAFDEIINGTNDHSDLEPPKLILNKLEKSKSVEMIAQVKSEQQKQKTIVIQPYGSTAELINQSIIIDESSRSLEQHVYLKLVKKLSTKYNLVFFGEEKFYHPEDKYTFKPKLDLRAWASVIGAADYFVGCDSVGQHMARALNKSGTVVIGSTFPVNTTYPDYFNIFEKKNVLKQYSPIRISGLESHLADRINDRCMDFDEKEIDTLYNSIVADIDGSEMVNNP